MAARVALEQVYDFDDTDGCQKDEAVLRRIAGITNIPEAEFSVWREAVLEELKKCELVCANCHVVRTVTRASGAKR